MHISTDFTSYDILQLDIEILAEVLKLSQELVFWATNHVFIDTSEQTVRLPEAEATLQQVHKTFDLIEKEINEINDSAIVQARQANRILDEAEEAFSARSRAQERAASGIWGQPEKVADYLFWIEDEAGLEEERGNDPVYAKALQGVAEELRVLGFAPSPPSDERVVIQEF